MSFLRHKEINPFDGGAGFVADASAHRLDEFPAGYSLAGWSPPVPASASPTASEYEAQPLRTSTDFQRTPGCVLTRCFSPGGKGSCCRGQTSGAEGVSCCGRSRLKVRQFRHLSFCLSGGTGAVAASLPRRTSHRTTRNSRPDAITPGKHAGRAIAYIRSGIPAP